MRTRACTTLLAAVLLAAGPHPRAAADSAPPEPPFVTNGLPARSWPDPTPPPPGPSKAERAIAAAKTQLGTPYRWGGRSPGGFDCSGLTSWAWAQAGVQIPRTSRNQFAGLPRVPVDLMRPGDLVFSGYGGHVSHVGIYLGEGQMIHSPRSGRHVEISPLHDNVIGAGRPAA